MHANHRNGLVLVRQAVVDAGPVLPGRDDSCEAELCEVLGYGCRRLIEELGKMIDRLLFVTQSQDDPDPGRISEHPEDLDRQLDVLAIGKMATKLLICIHTQIISQLSEAVQAVVGL